MKFGLILKKGERFNEKPEVIPGETRKEFGEMPQDLLGKAHLTNLYEKLNLL